MNIKYIFLFWATMMCLNAQAQTTKPKSIAHAVDSIGIGNSRGLKLYVAGSDSLTFNRIFGYLYEPAKELEGKEKRAVDLLVYETEKNLISLFYRDEKGSTYIMTPPSKIEEYLTGKGKNQKGETVTMAEDCNITIE